MTLLNLDARWQRFNDPSRINPLTGEGFNGVFDLGFDHPASWPHTERGTAAYIKEGADQLSADLCRVGEDRFLCTVLSLPVQGSDETLHISGWVQVPHDVFYTYLKAMDQTQPLPAATPALLANDIAGLAAEGAEITLSFPSFDARPVIDGVGGLLGKTLAEGISFDHLLDLYAAFGHDIRPHLTQD